MTKERRALLILLAAAAFVSFLGALLYAGLDRLRAVEDQIALLRRQYARLPADASAPSDVRARLSELKQAEDLELRRYYGKDEMDLYRFASLVNAMLARCGITVENFRTGTGPRGAVLELTTRGGAVSFTRFLSEVSSAPKYWAVPYLHMQSGSGGGPLTCELQIGYMVHGTSTQAP